jgi:hypothetical protein
MTKHMQVGNEMDKRWKYNTREKNKTKQNKNKLKFKVK